MAAAELTTSPVSGTLYLLLKNDRIVCQITGALSVSAQDVLVYDTSTHSELIDASMTGNAHMMPTVLKGSESNAASGFGGTLTSFSGSSALKGADSLAAGTTDSIMCDPSAVTPVPTQKTDTLFKWWSGASGSGNLVAMAWKSQIRYVGPVLPTMLT